MAMNGEADTLRIKITMVVVSPFLAYIVAAVPKRTFQSFHPYLKLKCVLCSTK